VTIVTARCDSANAASVATLRRAGFSVTAEAPGELRWGRGGSAASPAVQ
jgi:RimJ/RimL family protein N-acetyltransferase